jgi:uncharacterized protein (TIGR03083 family)
MNRVLVADVYRDGVAAVVSVAADLRDDTWGRPACGKWSASDTARHVLAVVRWYDTWLDRALTGDASSPFPASSIDQRNDEEITAFSGIDGPNAVALFEVEALAYLARAESHWDTPFGYPYGTATVGLHLGAAATEWHLHASDLATAMERTHMPRNGAALFRAAGACLAQTKPPLRRVILRLLVPIGALSKPWTTILRRSGRSA